MNFFKTPGIGTVLIGLVLLFILSYNVDVAQSRVDKLRIRNAEEKIEQIIQKPYANPVFQAGMVADTTLVLKSAQYDQQIHKMETWFHVVIIAVGAALLAYKWIKR